MLRPSIRAMRGLGEVSLFRAPTAPLLWVADMSGTVGDAFGLHVKKPMQASWHMQRVSITLSQIQVGMGSRKDNHYETMSQQVMPIIRELHPQASNEELEVYRKHYVKTGLEYYRPAQTAELKRAAGTLLIPEKIRVLRTLMNQNPYLQAALNTGFYQEQAEPIVNEFLAASVVPLSRFVWVTGSHVKNGRPEVDMLCNLTAQALTSPEKRTAPIEAYSNVTLAQIPVHLRHKVVSVDDTEEGIKAAQKFGCFSVLALEHSSHLNFSSIEEAKANPAEYQRQINQLIKDVARPLNPDFVTTSSEAWLQVHREVSQRLSQGILPGQREMTVVHGFDQITRSDFTVSELQAARSGFR